MSTRQGRRNVGDAGFTMVELVVAMVVLGILAMAIVGMVLQTQQLGVANRSRIAAANLAAREIDIVRERFSSDKLAPVEIADQGTVTNPNPLRGQVAGEPLVVDGKAYTVKRTSAWNLLGSAKSACDGGSLVSFPTLRVDVEVTWKDMGAIAPVRASTAIAPSKDANIRGTSAYVAVHVVDAAGKPNVGRAVTVYSAAESRTGVTDPSGCAVIQVHPAAGAGTSFMAKLGDPGYVDVANTAAPEKIVGVVMRGALSNAVTFAYDRSASVKLRFVDSEGALVADSRIAGEPFTLVASEFAGASGSTLIVATGATMQLDDLWPTRYGAYYGSVAPAGGYPVVVGGGPSIPTISVEVP